MAFQEKKNERSHNTVFSCTKKKLDTLARETGFIKRQRTVTATGFLAMMSFGRQSMKHTSLASMADSFDEKICRTSLHGRFSDEAVRFMQTSLHLLLSQNISQASVRTELLDPFQRVLLFDSSSWDINPRLSDHFKGSGGNASEANCKLQLGYDYKHGTVLLSELTPGIVPDNSYTHTLHSHIQHRDLVIFDLGYSALKTYEAIIEKKAFFLSRFNHNTLMYDGSSEKQIDLCTYLFSQKADMVERTVHIGVKARIPCRMVAMRVSDDVAERRRRKLRQEAKKKGYQVKEKNLKLASWTVMITNVDKIELPAEAIWLLYAVRWQIELLFKQFKSVLQIHESNTSKEQRLLCEIYGTLIAATFIALCHSSINAFLWNEGRRELSFDKFSKRIQERSFYIMKLFMKSTNQLMKYILNEFPELIQNCVKGQQRKRKSTLEHLELFVIKGKYSMTRAA